MLKEFKPALTFLIRFLGIYFAGNIAYGLYVESYGERPDVLTEWVTSQTTSVLQWLGDDVRAESSTHSPKVFMKNETGTVLSVFEGCNGINVLIIFVAFVIAFGGRAKAMAWFIPVGILVVHVSNLIRISLLYYVSLYYEQYFYYVHKYFFTAILYLIVFVLWAIWVLKLNAIRKDVSPT
jgi:exosortase family protein XrtF